MKQFLVFVALCASAAAAPEGAYNYKDPAPVVEHGNLNGFQPITFNGLPCTHASHHAGDSQGAAAALIQSQSTGRILNHPPHHNDREHSLETAASGHSQAVTVNSHIAVGDSGSAASTISGASQVFRGGEGYVQGGQSFSHQLPPLQHQPPHFHSLPPSTGFGAIPSQVVSGQAQGYYNQASASQASQQSNHIHHHYPAPGPNGHIGLPPPPGPPLPPAPPANGGYQYNPGFGNNKFTGPQGGPIRIPLPPPPQPPKFYGTAPYRPPGPIVPGPIGNINAPRPVQHFNNNYQQGSGSYAGAFGHNNHNVQHSGAHSQAQFNFNAGASSHNAGQSSTVFNANSLSAADALNGQLGHVIRETFASAPLDPTVEKHIYVHVPPEDLEENAHRQAASTQLVQQAQPKKHYKIIFIKAPSAAQPNYAQLAAAAAPQTEEKTLVYVLVKKPDEPSYEELQQLQQSTYKTSKPEVYFIKYKTRKEGEQQGPVFNGGGGTTQYNSADNFGATAGGIVGGADLSQPIGGNFGGDAGNDIDIRFTGGESAGGAVSTSNSYSTSSSVASSSSSSSSASVPGPHHELYGVPLE